MTPGKKIICLNDSHENEYKGLVFQQWIKKWKEYTIREIFDNDDICECSVLLEEVQNIPVFIPVLQTYREPAFRITRFAEVNELVNIKEEVVETSGILDNVI